MYHDFLHCRNQSRKVCDLNTGVRCVVPLLVLFGGSITKLVEQIYIAKMPVQILSDSVQLTFANDNYKINSLKFHLGNISEECNAQELNEF